MPLTSEKVKQMQATDRLMTVDVKTRDIARDIHFATRATIKDIVHAALTEYAANHGLTVTTAD